MVTVEKVLNDIEKNQMAPVYLVLGEEQVNAEKIKQKLIANFPEEEREFNIGIYDMEEVTLSTALADAMSVPFFGEKRLVFINRPYFLTGEAKKVKLEHDLDELIAYVNDPEPTTVLVLMAPYAKLDERKKVVKQIKQKAVVVDNSPLTEMAVRKHLSAELAQKGYTIDPRSLEILLQRTNANLTAIANELPKLLLVAEDKQITVNEVSAMVSRSLEQNVFDLVELVLQKDTAKALELYRDLLQQKEEPLKINAILEGQFRLLLQVEILQKHGYAQGNIASTLKVHPYRVKLALQKTRVFKRQDLKNAYLGLIHIEERLKTTTQEPELLFQLFMLNFAQKAVVV